MWWLSGIFRDVELLGVPENGLEDFFIISDLDDFVSKWALGNYG